MDDIEELTAWVDEHVARTGPIENFRVRPWASVWRVPTDAGLHWLKTMSAVTGFEAGLYAVLVRVAPGDVLHPAAVDVQRRRLLLPDGGRPLLEAVPRDDLYDALATELRRYGALQRAVAPHVDDLLAAGVPDMRVERLPERLVEACEAVRPWARSRGTIDDRATLDRVAGMGDEVRAWCAELAALPGGASIDHNDLHPYNVLEDDRGHRTVYDWGDAAIAHPFASLLVPLVFCRDQLGATPSQLDAVRDAYLAAFADWGSHDELVHTADLACHLGKIARALTWQRLLSAMPEMADGFDRAPYTTLAALTEPGVGGA
jgi:hypothetical protein